MDTVTFGTRLRPGAVAIPFCGSDTAFERYPTWETKIDGGPATAFQSGVTATALHDASEESVMLLVREQIHKFPQTTGGRNTSFA